MITRIAFPVLLYAGLAGPASGAGIALPTLAAPAADPVQLAQAQPAQTQPAQTGPGASPGTAGGEATTFTIRDVQQLLNRRGYDAGPADGVMGPQTRAAIRTYQVDAGLPVTGEPTADLHASLTAQDRSESAPPAGAAELPSTGQVIEVQSALRRRGYDILAVDGELDPPTVAAIRRYQADAGLPVTGQPDAALIRSLNPADASGGPEVDRSVVADIQRELNQRGYDAGPVDGRPGDRTRTAIRTYQADAGLDVTGEPSRDLLRTIRQREQRATQPDGEQQGSELIIDQIRQELRRHGYGAAGLGGEGSGGDGTGPALRDAILAYQSDAGLRPTGEPSQALLEHMQSSAVAAPGQTPEDSAAAAIQGLSRALIDRLNRAGTVPPPH